MDDFYTCVVMIIVNDIEHSSKAIMVKTVCVAHGVKLNKVLLSLFQLFSII